MGRTEEIASAALFLASSDSGQPPSNSRWQPEGFVGQMFNTFAKFLARSGMPAPVMWGNETVVRERLGGGVSDLKMTRRHYRFDYPFPPAEVVELFRHSYGPTNRTFAALREERGKGAPYGTENVVVPAQSGR